MSNIVERIIDLTNTGYAYHKVSGGAVDNFDITLPTWVRDAITAGTLINFDGCLDVVTSTGATVFWRMLLDGNVADTFGHSGHFLAGGGSVVGGFVNGAGMVLGYQTETSIVSFDSRFDLRALNQRWKLKSKYSATATSLSANPQTNGATEAHTAVTTVPTTMRIEASVTGMILSGTTLRLSAKIREGIY
jgi:hypothetical protein